MNTMKILLRTWCVISGVLTLVLLIGIMIPIVNHIRLQGEKCDIEFNGPYSKNASIQDAISLGQYVSINDKSGMGALINQIRGIDLQQYIPEYENRGNGESSLLWFYRFTPVKLRRTGGCLEVIGTPNTNDIFCFILAPYEELQNVRTVQTLKTE